MSLQTNNSLEVESVCLMKIKDSLHSHVAEYVVPLKVEKRRWLHPSGLLWRPSRITKRLAVMKLWSYDLKKMFLFFLKCKMEMLLATYHKGHMTNGCYYMSHEVWAELLQAFIAWGKACGIHWVAEGILSRWHRTLDDVPFWCIIDAIWDRTGCIFLLLRNNHFPCGQIYPMPPPYLLVKSTQNLFSMMTRYIPNYSKDVIDFSTNNKASHRRIVKPQVVASVNVTI